MLDYNDLLNNTYCSDLDKRKHEAKLIANSRPYPLCNNYKFTLCDFICSVLGRM